MPRQSSFYLHLVVLSCALGLAACSGEGSDGLETYLFETVERGMVVSEVTATGTVNPVTTVQVGTYVSGPIRAIDVDFNSPVRRGQRVAKIDPATFQVKVQRAEANLATARARVNKDEADLRLKKLQWERAQQLAEQALVAVQEVDAARSDYDQAVAQLALDRATVKQAQADLDEARINLAYTDITSPVDGVVVSRNVDVGQTVAATFQTPTLFLIAEDLTKMQIDTSVSESDIGPIQSGQAASFRVDAYPGKSFVGTVMQVRSAPTIVQNVVTYDVVVAVDNPALELKPGMTANVTIVTAQREDVLRVSVRALRFRPDLASASGTAAGTGVGAAAATPRATEGEDAPHVFLLQSDGSLRRVAVQVGIRNDVHAEVTSADLNPGDQVAVGIQRAQKTPKAQSIPGMPRFR